MAWKWSANAFEQLHLGMAGFHANAGSEAGTAQCTALIASVGGMTPLIPGK